MSRSTDKVLAISGGVGGAKLALGLSGILAPEQLLICANTGDDFSHLGLRICPDLDTVMYTLAGISNQQLGWGLADESWQFMAQLSALGGEDWFRLGDRDVATHVLRSHLLASGMSLSAVMRQLCQRIGVAHPIVPMSDQPVATRVQTDEGELSFQHYFVRRSCEPCVQAIEFGGIEQAQVQRDVLAWLADAELGAVLICPSNPFVSVAPVLAVPGMRAALRDCSAPVIAVSPIVGGDALKGPAAKMMRELDMPVSALAVARYYSDVVDGFVIDEIDRAQASCVESLGLRALVTATVMRGQQDKENLARAVLSFARDCRSA
jgi:LPPG:FO 2-phospho-L-lactate transferase